MNTAWSYRPALDGLRTVAIYLVVVFHAGLTHASNGYIGVDVFFVLSGFLVTSIILREHDDTGTLRLRRFYARRIRRLLPASVVLVASTCVMSVMVLPRLSRLSLVADARAALLYVANWHFLNSSTDYFAADVQRSPFLHFWSLAIEEQFYFVFPLMLLGALMVARRRRLRWAVPVALGSAMVASLVLQLLIAPSDPLRAYYGTDARLYQLLAGGLLASLAHHLTGRWRGAPWVSSIGVVIVVLLATDLFTMSVATRGVLAVAVTVAVVAALELAPVGPAAAVLSTSPFTYLGRISYGTYLWHWPIVVLVGAAIHLSPWKMAVVAAIGATAISALSFAVLETPIRRAPRLDAHPRAVVAVGLACSLLVAVVVVPPILHSDRRPTWAAPAPTVTVTGDLPDVDTATLVAAMATPAPREIDMALTEPPSFDQTACSATDLTACVLHQGSGMRLHLIGDSNAMVLIPLFLKLAERYDFTLTVTARVGCPWQLGLEWEAQDDALVRHCAEARDSWYSTVIPALHPDVVVAVHVPRDRGSRADAFFRAGPDTPSGESLTDVVRADTDTSLDRFRSMGARVVLYEPLPYDRRDPTVCLSGASTVGECAYEANAAPFPTEVLYREEAAARDGVWVVDPDRFACPYLPVCVPLVGGELVFRNQFHLSNAWVLDHADAWWSQLVATGALRGWFDPS